MALKQASRLLNLKTPLGENELLLTGFSGEEGLSQLFRFELEMISDNNAIAPKDVVGKNVTFSVQLADESPRHFNGLVSRFSAGDEDVNGRRSYRAEVVPNFWFLTRHADCRIFENKSLKQIIEQVFNDRGLSDFKIDFKGSHPERVYCVQFRESDFNFLSRLMEEEGVWYAFKHEDGKHTMLIADKSSAYFDCQQKEVDYPFDFGTLAAEDHIRSWRHEYEFRSGKVAQSDYNFETPSTDLGTNSSTIVKDVSGADKYELFDYPGYYPDKGAGQPLADVRMEEEEVEHDVALGTSLCRAFTPGGKFKVRQHRSSSEKGKSYVITTVQHRAYEPLAYETGLAPAGESASYDNSFTCIPDSVNFRPQRKTRKPSVKGLQSAVVIGDDEIPTDEYGRVRVRFPWDRKGKEGGTGTCWVRVSQLWASAEWGGMHIPHKDDEVLVDFIDGDPDRPMIVGRVYNADRKVPLPLPDHKTKSIIRDYGDNQMIWEGKPGEQHIRLEQQCGNFFQMNAAPGQESIKIQDKFGNCILLNSPDKTVSIYSPNHESGILLGKSAHVFSNSAGIEWKGGNDFKAFAGTAVTGAMGLKVDVFCGASVAGVVGDKVSLGAGSSYECAWGTKVTWAKQGTYTISSGDAVLDSKKNSIIDADQDIHLLGGDNDEARLQANSKELLLTYKPGGPSRSRATVPVVALVGTGAAIIAQSALTYAQETKARTLSYTGVKEQDEKTASAFAKLEAVSTTANTAAAAAVSMFAQYMAVKKLKSTGDQRKEFKPHEAPNARIRLHVKGTNISADDKNQVIALLKDKGIGIISQDQMIQIKAKSELVLRSDKAVFHSAPKHQYKDGEIDHKNFKVLQ